jgi:large subunit ribosomal protein L15
MKLHDLETPNSKTRKRVGRGQGSGLGQQSGRGHKGAKSRHSYKRKGGFEGGQMPMVRRIPKSGFINPFKVSYIGINLSVIQKGIDAGKLTNDVTIEGLINAGLLHKGELAKILGQGDLKGAVSFKVNAWSASAEEKIKAAGGSIETAQ